MNSAKFVIRAVPTNIITGFLGVGKTSAILHLLKQKPIDERWAVLVNEFGEIGIDGSLLAGQHSNGDSVFIREVPGGCMCCAAGLPMPIALNQLLAKAKPDRLLIEPTGLGHPKEVLQILSAEYYQDVLSLHKTVALVDARKLSDPRYTSHDTFNQQIAIADIVIGNKQDLYRCEDNARLVAYVHQRGQALADVLFTQHGEIPFSTLQGLTRNLPIHRYQLHQENHTKSLAPDVSIPECGFIKAMSDGEGYSSVGWRFSSHTIFNRQRLFSFLRGLRVERMKAVFITDAGAFGYNLTIDALTEIELDDCLESRVEIISEIRDDSLETQLLACVVA